MFNRMPAASAAKSTKTCSLLSPPTWPWAPLDLRTRSGGEVLLVTRLGHTYRDWWIECDVKTQEGRCQRAMRLHPAQIVSAGASEDELGRLQEAVRRYLDTHGRWINCRWEPHDNLRLSRAYRLRKARRKRVQRRARRTEL